MLKLFLNLPQIKHLTRQIEIESWFLKKTLLAVIYRPKWSCTYLLFLGSDHCASPVFGKNFEKQSMRYTAVHNDCRLNSVLYCF